MTNTARNRFAIDLDEIERNLSTPATPAAAKNDPLSELAKIVGQDDPFRSILKAQPAPAARAHDGYDDLFVTRGDGAQRRYADPSQNFEAELAASLRGPIPVDSRHVQPAQGHAAYGQNPAELDWVQHDRYAQPSAEADWDQSYAPVAHAPAPRARGNRKGLLTVAAVLGVAALGVTSALLVGAGRPGGLSGEPPLIKAQQGPLKVQPENPGGVEIPNQNKQIYERAASEKTKVVNREEQPLDVAQATRQPQRAPAAPAPAAPGVDTQAMRQAMQAAAGLVPPAPASVGAPAAQPNTAGMPSLGEPRRVRTVSVRPDGSIVAADGAPPAPPMRPTSMPQTQPAPTRVAGAAPVATPMPATTASTPAAPSRPAAATPSATPAPPTRTAAVEPPRPAAPTPPPAPTKEQQRLANLPATPAPAAPAASDDAPATRTTAGGGFVVQLGVATSEAGAREAFNGFRARYGAALSGASPGIVKAEVNGNTVYRVRTAPMDRADANEACTKVKASGGSCFVARN